MTESGNVFGYEASVRILDPEIGIRSFLRFEDVPLLKSSKINLATLYVYAGFDQGETISPGASVTIYGIDEPDCAPFSYSGQVWSLERPYTTASVNWNVSDWHQVTWKTVNVTSIVKEIINQYAWTQNNSIGFQILGASDTGYEYRTFEDIDHQYHGAYAYLYLQYDVPPGTPPSGIPGDAVFIETYGEYDIWTSLEYENFYEDWTELDPLNLIGTSALNPYRITFADFGYEEYWDDLTYFRRDEDLNITADNIEIRFKATLTGEEVPYSRPDFHWISLYKGTDSIHVQHHLLPDVDDDHHFTLGCQAMTFGSAGMFMADPIPPIKTQWYSFLWDYSLKQITLRQYLTEPNSSAAWYTDFDTESNESAIDVHLARYTDVYAPRSRLGSDFYNGLNWGYLENMAILVDFVPVANETVYYVLDDNETIIWTDVAPDIGWVEDYIDDYLDPEGGDPLDPDPGTQEWDTEGPFTRFNMRLYFLVIGLGCIFGPLWAMGYKKLDSVGYAWCALIMILGTGLLWSIVGI